MSDISKAISDSFNDANKALNEFIADKANTDKVKTLSDLVTQAFKAGHMVYIAGNGGSHCDALHFAEEFTGRYRGDRKALPAMALGEASHSTCVSNDYGFDFVFSRQLEAFGKKGDVFIALSTSGNSKNLITANATAKELGLSTFALLGKGGGELKDLADHNIMVPGDTSDRIQEIHMMILHIVIEAVERELFPENY